MCHRCVCDYVFVLVTQTHSVCERLYVRVHQCRNRFGIEPPDACKKANVFGVLQDVSIIQAHFKRFLHLKYLSLNI